MKAVSIERHGGPEVLTFGERPDPVPGPGEVRVRVAACALNHLDLWVRQGARSGVRLPLIPGSDVVGTVESAGPGAAADLIGKRVVLFPARACGACDACRRGVEPLCLDYAILGRSLPGGYAQFVTAPTRNVFPAPEVLSDAEAASLPLASVTAYEMLFSRAKLGPGETVLVTAAAGGVGVAAVQLAKAFGATVIASAGSPAKAARLKALGADHAVDRLEEDLAARVREITAGSGVDVVCDSVGGEGLGRLADLAAPGGRVVFCGVTAGPETRLDIAALFARRVSLLGSFMGSRWQLEACLALAARGALKPIVDRIFPLAEARRAHEHLAAGAHVGKVVLAVD